MSHSTNSSSRPASPIGSTQGRRRSRSPDSDDERPRHRPATDPRTRYGKHIARTIHIRPSMSALFSHGIRILADHAAGNIDALPTDDKKFILFQAVIAIIPDGRSKLTDAVWVAETTALLAKGAKSARSDDTSGLKKAIVPFLGDHTIPLNSKVKRGFNHRRTGELLCPPKLDWFDPEVRAKLQNEVECPKVKEWPCFLYKDGIINPNNELEGLFMSDILINSAKHIFTSPSSAGEGSTRATRSSNAYLSGMTEVTRGAVAYVAAQARFALSSDESFGTKGPRKFDTYAFYENILNFLNRPEIEDDVETILDAWTEQLFGTESDGDESGDEGTAARILRQKQLAQSAA